MQEAMLPLLASWQNFYVIIGTAAATLTGLMFVVITLIANLRTRVMSPSDGIAFFSTPNIVHYCTALLTAALLSAPWQELWNVSLLLGLTGLWGMIYVILALQHVRRRQIGYQPVLEDWLWHTVLPFLSYCALVVAALLLLVATAHALFIIAVAVVLFLFIGIHNAWDNVTYMVIQLPPQKPGQERQSGGQSENSDKKDGNAS